MVVSGFRCAVGSSGPLDPLGRGMRSSGGGTEWVELQRVVNSEVQAQSLVLPSQGREAVDEDCQAGSRHRGNQGSQQLQPSESCSQNVTVSEQCWEPQNYKPEISEYSQAGKGMPKIRPGPLLPPSNPH